MILAVAAAALSLRIDWTRANGAASAEVYASRAAVANDQIAVRLTEAELAKVRRAVRGFAAMPERFGEPQSGDRSKVRGRVSVNGKTVIQFDEGKQSKELAALVTTVLTTVETAARKRGVGARDLPDALAKLAAGAIPLEALHVAAQSRGEPGWLLQLHGYELSTRRYANGEYSDPVRSQIGDGDLRALVALLRDAAPSSFPRRVYAPAYTELRIDVLGRAVDVQARPANAEKVPAFDRVIERLRELASAR